MSADALSAVRVVVASVVGMGCSSVVDDPRNEELRRGGELALLLRERACASVVAAFRNGARPTAVEVQLPGPGAADPPSRLLLVGPHVPSAESCLGLPEIVTGSTTAALPTAALPTTGLPSAVPSPASSARRSPLDTRF
jgi:hypothetical protein